MERHLMCADKRQDLEIVYTWVDDRLPGYQTSLQKYSKNPHDLNPNRTRDNLDMLMYSLRSLDLYAPWAKRITLISMRPQIPDWLNVDHPDINVIHHDQFIPKEDLPTFSSFSIISNFQRLKTVGIRFLYLEDDMLFTCPVGQSLFLNPQGQIKVYPRLAHTPDAAAYNLLNTSPWNFALSHCNHLLNEKYSGGQSQKRRHVNHIPIVVDRDVWQKLWDVWPVEMASTSASKFRSKGNVAPEYLYLQYLVNESLGEQVSLLDTYRLSGYIGLENNILLNELGLLCLKLLNAPILTINDNFGEDPKKYVVSKIRKFLNNRYPIPGRFEKSDQAIVKNV